jgi:hypothetical protein
MSETTEPQITETDAQRMADMRHAGLTLDEIAHAYGTTRVAVYQALEAHDPAALKPRGRIPVLNLDPKPSPEQAAAARRSRRHTIAAIAAVLAVALGCLIGVLVTSGGGSKGGFYNMTTLAKSVQSQVGQDSAYGTDPVVEGCSIVTAQTAQCIISPGFGNDYGDTGGQTQGITVSIAANGQSWTQQS